METLRKTSEVAQEILHRQEFREEVKNYLQDHPDTDVMAVFYLLIHKTHLQLGVNPQSKEGVAAAQEIFRSVSKKEVRKLFHLSEENTELSNIHHMIKGIHDQVSHLVPLQDDQEQGLEKPTQKPTKEQMLESIEKLQGSTKQLLVFLVKIEDFKNFALEGGGKSLWTARLKKENVSIRDESAEWKILFDQFLLTEDPLPEQFFQNHPELEPLKIPHQKLRELAQAIKIYYKKEILPLVLLKRKREEIHPNKIPDFYKTKFTEVVDFIKGGKRVEDYLNGLFELHDYTPRGFNINWVSDVFKKGI
jgi:hypothetical protein